MNGADVVALLFGSRTNRLWVENDRYHLWLLNHDHGPTLFMWENQIGTDPLVRRSRLVVSSDGMRLDSIDQVPLSET